MSSTALTILQQTFGFTEFRTPQEAIINRILEGGDALVLMPTGGGKSLCYQIPAILREGVGVVVSPLIALMEDQVTALQQAGVSARFLNSSLSTDEQREVEQALLKGKIDLLYVAPERLNQSYFLSLLDHIPIALFAIDEAHCVSQWGHDFRVDYLQLSILHERFPHVPRVALTATADSRTRNEIIHRLDLASAEHYVSGFDRPNIQYRITEKTNAKQQLLQFIRREHQKDSGIVYCLSRRKVEQMAEWLNQNSFNALPYHAGLSAETRRENQTQFLREEGVIVVATIAFGMGIDKPDVRFVAHLDLPKSLEAYYQETGRAGRDGMPANAWMAYGIQDVIKLRQMLEASQGNDEFKQVERHKLDAMLGFCEISTCRRQTLLQYFSDELDQPCGNCDTCLHPVETWDATNAAQKALSCVYRTGQRFGVGHLLDVLQGKETDRVINLGHHQLSTFAIGKDLSEQQWRSVFRQLVARGYITVDVEGYGSLYLTEKSRPVLRGEETLFLRKDREKQLSNKTSGKNANKHNQLAASDDKQLWEILRTLRSELAKEQGVPPYVIFHDATLMELVQYRPINTDEFSKVNGVGKSKLEHYAKDFINVITEFEEKMAMQDSSNDSGYHTTGARKNGSTQQKESSQLQTLDLLHQGLTVEQIAEVRDLKVTTVYTHISELIEDSALELHKVVDLPSSVVSIVNDMMIEQLSDTDKIVLSPIYEALDADVSYDILKCIRANILKEMKKAS
ncbi:MAG: DNA helicase RecQ [Cellvibrionaceae bacterium]